MYHSLDLTTHYLLEQSGVSKAKTKYYYLNMQQYGSHPTQLFNIRLARKSNGDIEQGVYKIYSHQYSGMLLSLSDGVCHNNTDILLWNEKNQPYEKWKITPGGTIENVHCKKMVIDISSYVNGGRIQSYKKNDEWGQAWSLKSDDVVLARVGDGDNSQKNTNQTWTTEFVDVGYDLGIHPGFPGNVESCSGSKCLSSRNDKDLAIKVMGICDKSMAFLVGPQLSVGTLKTIVDSVEAGGADQMPGYCCMDYATDSDLFGYNVRLQFLLFAFGEVCLFKKLIRFFLL